MVWVVTKVATGSALCRTVPSGGRMANKFFNIIGGPSKFELMLGLFDNTMSEPRRVSFQLQGGTALSVCLLSVGREDGSGESWLFEGAIQWPDASHNRRVKGYFTTKRRTGHVVLIED